MISYAKDSPRFYALHVHVRLANSERVDVRLIVQACEAVIDKSMRRLVRADSVHHFQQRRIRTEAPVIFGNLRRRGI